MEFATLSLLVAKFGRRHGVRLCWRI